MGQASSPPAKCGVACSTPLGEPGRVYIIDLAGGRPSPLSSIMGGRDRSFATANMEMLVFTRSMYWHFTQCDALSLNT